MTDEQNENLWYDRLISAIEDAFKCLETATDETLREWLMHHLTASLAEQRASLCRHSSPDSEEAPIDDEEEAIEEDAEQDEETDGDTENQEETEENQEAGGGRRKRGWPRKITSTEKPRTSCTYFGGDEREMGEAPSGCRIELTTTTKGTCV